MMMRVDLKSVRRGFGAFALYTLFAFAPVFAQTRALPDFTDLVEQVGPSVVNIRTLEKVSARSRSGNGPDEEMLEFFRRFGVPIPNTPRRVAGSKARTLRRKRKC